jgi:hypothetical protein
MITRFARHTSRLLIALTTLFTIAACGGGGGGSGGGGFLPDDGGDDPVYFLELALTDAFGDPTNTITTSSPAQLSVTVTEGEVPLEGIVVSAESDIGLVVPLETGTALTDADGIALFRMESDGIVGAGTITVSTTIEEITTTATLNIQVVRPDLRLGYFEGNTFIEGEISVVPEEITAGGSSALTLAIVDEVNQRVTTEETILLGSDCSRNGDAILPSSVSTLSGQVTKVMISLERACWTLMGRQPVS